MNRKAPPGREERSALTRRLAVNGLLFAAALVLTAVEWMLPPIPGLPPGVRLGLSNIVVMYALFFMDGASAFTLAALKAVFTAVTRGYIAGLLSLCGGLLSVLVMLLLLLVFKKRISYLLLSVFGAVAHNLGQLAAVCVLYGFIMRFYLPILLVSGIVAGVGTSVLLKVVLPALRRLRA